MSDQPRDESGRFATGDLNRMFRRRAALRVGVSQPASHVVMNDRLRGARSLASDEINADVPNTRPEGLEGGASGADIVTPAEKMNALLRRKFGYGPELGTNGLPLGDGD